MAGPRLARCLGKRQTQFVTVDWSLLHALDDFMAGHDDLEDTLLFYVEASELLFVVTLAVVFLLARGPNFLDWRRATVRLSTERRPSPRDRQGDL